MPERDEGFRLGLFVLVSLLLLAGLVLVFSGTSKVFNSKKDYFVTFADAPGIATGAPVRRSGVKVGEVDAIDLDAETGKVRVKIKLDPKYKPRTGEEPTLTRGLLVGDTSIDFVPKSLSEKISLGEIIPEGAEIQGVSPLNTRAMITQASDMVPEAQRSMEQMRRSLEKLEQLAPQFQKTLESFEKIGPSVQRSVEAIEKMTPTVQRTLDAAEKVMPQVQKTLEAVEKLTPTVQRSLEAFEKMSPQIQITLKEFGELAKSGREFLPEVKKTNDSLRTAIDHINDTAPDAKQLVRELRKTNDDVRYLAKMAAFWTEEVGFSLKSQEGQIAKAIDTVTRTVERAGELLKPENQKLVTDTLASLRDAAAKADRVASTAEDVAKDAKLALRSIKDAASKGEMLVDEIRQNVKTLGDSTTRIVKSIEASSEQVTKTLADAREIIRAVGKAEGSFMKFITDPSLFNNLNETTVILMKLAPRLDRILADAEVFADKIARHPESLGVGGAVRPSAGLKEVPLAPVPVPPWRP